MHKKFKAKIKKVIDSNCNKCQTCTNCIKAHEAWENYRKQRNLTNKITKDNKRKNLVDDLKAKSSKNDLKGIWKSIKLAANLPTKSNTSVDIDKNLDAKKPNEHFCTVGPSLRSKIPVYDIPDYQLDKYIE